MKEKRVGKQFQFFGTLHEDALYDYSSWIKQFENKFFKDFFYVFRFFPVTGHEKITIRRSKYTYTVRLDFNFLDNPEKMMEKFKTLTIDALRKIYGSDYVDKVFNINVNNSYDKKDNNL